MKSHFQIFLGRRFFDFLHINQIRSTTMDKGTECNAVFPRSVHVLNCNPIVSKKVELVVKNAIKNLPSNFSCQPSTQHTVRGFRHAERGRDCGGC